MGAQVSYLLIIESRECIRKAVGFSRNPLRDNNDITSSGTQEGVAERRVCRTAKRVLVEACTSGRVVGMNEDSMATPLVREELKGL
jgi:hypothetical protein